jgi:hypothetical protein
MADTPRLDLPDRDGVQKRIREAAGKLKPSTRIDQIELDHLVDVVTNHALLLNDLYAQHRLDQILGSDPVSIMQGLADLERQEHELEGETLSHLRRIPDDVRVVGDKCLYDVGLFGRQEYQGLDLKALGIRCYSLSSEILEYLAEDRRLREYFRRNQLGPMPIEEEVIFLKQCGDRFLTYADLLRSLHLYDPEEASLSGSTLAPARTSPPPMAPPRTGNAGGRRGSTRESTLDSPPPTKRRRLTKARATGLSEKPGESESPRSRRPGLPGIERLPRRDLLSLYERLVLFANLEVPELQEDLNRIVVDQRDAVGALADELSLYATGTQTLSRPASFFLVGPTGVGKNYLVESFVKTLEERWRIEVPMLLIEGPQYTYPSDINELKGATRGFIRSDEEGILTEFYKRASEAPLSVLLVDEVEKAHPQLRKFFLGLMDRGSTMDNRGATLHFVNTIFFYTSNVGYSRLQSSTAPIGFADTAAREEFKYREVVSDLKKVLSPEFVNRTSIIRFHQLTTTSVERIFDLEYAKVAARYLDVQGLILKVTPSAREELIRQGYHPEFGARPLARLINQVCNVEVSKRLKRDDMRSPEETGDLLGYLREVRDGKRALDPSAVDQILEQTRAQVPYDTLRIDWKDGEFLYQAEEPMVQ